MAIDKIIPRFLNTDKDERLLAGDEMTDALNVVMSSVGEGSDESVLKNIKGFTTVANSTISDIFDSTKTYTAIGSVVDHQNEDIYWFVHGTSNDHLVFKHDVSADSITVIYRGSWLNFGSTSYVKADVITLSIAEETTPQTILYFTDNRNEPRKINVTRATGTTYYNDLTDGERDNAFSSMRAAQNKAPTFVFTTDTSYTVNNFVHNPFQFAVQYIYKDGEESAISVYSKMAVCPVDFTEGFAYESSADFISPNSFNVCEVRLNLKDDIADVKRVRLIAKRGNDGSFFLVDEFDPFVDKESVHNNASFVIYNADTQTYQFRNDVVGPAIDTNTVNKMFDNVPYLAETQAIASNRLIYANYTEGRENFDVVSNIKDVTSSAPTIPTLQVEYNDASLTGTSYLNTTATLSNEIAELGPASGDGFYDGVILKVKVNIPGLLNSVATPTVPASTVTTISFDFAPETPSPDGKVEATDGQNFISATVQKLPTSLGGGNIFSNNVFQTVTLNALKLYEVDAAKTVSISVQNAQDVTHTELADQIIAAFEQVEVELKYSLGGTSGHANNLSMVNTDESNETQAVHGDLHVTYKFDSATNSSGNITLHPRISKVDFRDAHISNPSSVPTSGTNGFSYQFAAQGSSNLLTNFDTAAEQTFTHLGGATNAHYVTNEAASFLRTNRLGSFKAGSSHKFGIVYFDKYNRSGFVNDLGSVYVQWPGERSAGATALTDKGSASVRINLTDINGFQVAPVWSDRYQIVYSGAVDVSDFVQYTVGGAFPGRFSSADLSGVTNGGFINQQYINVNTEPGDGEPDFVKCQLFVNIDTLELYKSEKDTLRDYSFTKGDKLRVVSYDAASYSSSVTTYTTTYPVASDGSIIEFDVVGTVVLTDQTASQVDSEIAGHADTDEERHQGTFLVLEQPAITTGATHLDGSGAVVPLAYEGFDFFSVAQTRAGMTGVDPSTTSKAASYRYRGSGVASGANDPSYLTAGLNYWGNRCVVEIYSPAQKNAQEVYYEIGVGGPTNVGQQYSSTIGRGAYDGDGTAQVSKFLDSGDITFRKIPMKSPVVVSGTTGNFDHASLDKSEDFPYHMRAIESKSLSDFYDSDFWDRGRPHVKFLSASENTIGNSLIFSEAYTQGSENLKLSSFNPSLANFHYLERAYGDINFINNYNEDLVAVQQNKFSITPLNKNIIEYATGSSNLAVSTNLFGATRYAAGDFGCGSHGESVTIVDNDIAFIDPAKEKAMLFTGGQLVPISDKGVSSFFGEDFITSSRTRYITGYDPDMGIFYYTALGGSNEKTIGYYMGAGKWQSLYSFLPDEYANVGNIMAAFKASTITADGVTKTKYLFTHTDEVNRNSVFGQAVASSVEVVSKLSPSRVKVFNAVSYEGTSPNWTTSAFTTSLGQTSGSISSFGDDREGAYYQVMPRDTSSNSTSENVYLGNLTTSDDTTFTSSNVRIDRLNLPLGVTVTINSQSVIINSVSKNTFTLSASNSSIAGNNRTMDGPSTNGDPMRGNWIKVTFRNTDATEHELYCINTHITDSKYHHALGEQ